MSTAKVTGAELNYGELGSYSQVVGILAGSYRVIVYDRRFCGRSRSSLMVQTRDMVCHDGFALMYAQGIHQAFLGGGSFVAAISFGCAARRLERVKANFPSNIYRRRHHLRHLTGEKTFQEPGDGNGPGYRSGHRCI